MRALSGLSGLTSGFSSLCASTIRPCSQRVLRQTRPLVDYYSNWAKADAAAAPKYRAISGMGSVEDITARALEALSS